MINVRSLATVTECANPLPSRARASTHTMPSAVQYKRLKNDSKACEYKSDCRLYHLGRPC